MLINKTLITIYFWVWVVIGVTIGTIVIIPAWLLGASKKWCRRYIEIILAGIPYHMMKIAGFWNVEWIDNRINTDDTQTTCVVVSNHLSASDTIFTALLPFDKIYTWNKVWSKVPFFGWLCLMAGHITVDSKSQVSKRAVVETSIKHLRDGKNILFYAEGKRSSTPKSVLPFKTGAFRVAKEVGVPILPITLIGTYDACNRGICDYADLKIIIDEYIKSDEIDMTIDKVRGIIQYNISDYYKTN